MSKILLIEDDQVAASTLKDWLQMQRHVVDVTYFGEDGLHMLKSFDFDVAIIDWELPDIDGVEVVRRYREHGGQIPILVLTGRKQLDDKEKGLDSGADDYLTKPFEMRELAARLRALLRRSTPNKTTTISFCKISLDTVTRRVTVDDIEIELRPKEFGILECLIQHPDRLFAADEIIDRLWKTDESGAVDTLRSHITRLRSKIEAIDKSATIESVYGRGYRLVESTKKT